MITEIHMVTFAFEYSRMLMTREIEIQIDFKLNRILRHPVKDQ